MGIVCPDDDPCGPFSQVTGNLFKRVNHMPVAKVPRSRPALEHRPVIALGIGHDSCALFGGKERWIERPIALREIGGSLLHLHPLADDPALTIFAQAETGRRS